jgi:predicted dinucleotide-binding enzyme
MKIGVIGSGVVGQSLALGFIKFHDEVMIGTNDKNKYAELKEKMGGKARVGSFEETAKFGELLVLAVKGSRAEEALRSAGVGNLKGKTVIDTNNPIAETAPINGVLSFFTSPNESLLERLQKTAPDAHFVKGFSCIGSGLMVNPDFGGAKPSMFICGNNERAKGQVSEIAKKFGFDVEDMGGAEAARGIEPLCILWCIPGFQRNQWTHAFKLLKK